MASNIHVKIDGVEGESKVEGFTEFIDIESYQYGASNPITRSGGGLSGGKAVPASFSFTMVRGKSSLKLQQFCNAGQHVATITLKETKMTGDLAGEQVYWEQTFTDCFIQSAYGGSHSNAGDVQESFNVEYTQIEATYFEQKTQGGTLENAANAKWNYQTNTGN